MTVPAIPDQYRVDPVASDNKIGVDRENNAIMGYVVIEEGDTKDYRGSFDMESLQSIVQLGNEAKSGVKMRFQHPGASDDGLGRFVGRAKNFRLDTRDGHGIVRADAYLNDTAMTQNVNGGTPYGEYLLDLAESDPGALQTSVVIPGSDIIERKPKDGKPQKPIIRPKKLIGSDFVDEGNAVHGDLFSIEGLDEFMEGSERRIPTNLATAFSRYADKLFVDSDRDVVESRLNAFRDRYLTQRFGDPDPVHQGDPSMDQETKDAIEGLAQSTDEKFAKLFETLEADRKERKEELNAQQRAAEITAICEMSGHAEKGECAKWIADSKFSVHDVRKILFERGCQRNAPVDDDGEQSSTSDPNDKFRAEYAENLDLYKKLNTSEADYIRHRRKEEGLPSESAA